MSGGSLVTLARLSDARQVPLPLYTDGWPHPSRRLAQLVFAASQWLWFRPPGWVLRGQRLPAAAGEVHFCSTLTLRDWFRGAYVMRNAQLARLTERLGLDGDVSHLYLADADVLVVFGSRDGAPVVIHISPDPGRLQRYCEHSEQARRELAAHGLSEIVPKVIEQRAVLDLQMMVQPRLKGRKVLAARFSPDAERQIVEAALRPLQALAESGRPDQAGADSHLIATMLQTLVEHPALCAAVVRPLEALRAWEGRWALPSVLAHGDYCLTNVLYSEGSEPEVCAVLDWERARLNACSGFDALYFVVFSYAHWRKSTVMRVLCDLWQDACEPQLERLLDTVRATLRLSTADLKHLALAIWLRHLHQHASDLERWSARRRRDWLDEPARCAHNWLTATPR